MLLVLIFEVYTDEFQLLVAKPLTRLFMIERKPVSGKDSLEVVCSPIPVTPDPAQGRKASRRRPLSGVLMEHWEVRPEGLCPARAG